MEERDWFEGVTSLEAGRAHYNELVRQFHPDRARDQDELVVFHTNFLAIDRQWKDLQTAFRLAHKVAAPPQTAPRSTKPAPARPGASKRVSAPKPKRKTKPKPPEEMSAAEFLQSGLHQLVSIAAGYVTKRLHEALDRVFRNDT